MTNRKEGKKEKIEKEFLHIIIDSFLCNMSMTVQRLCLASSVNGCIVFKKIQKNKKNT